MKKLLAVLLSILCVLSVFGFSASASQVLEPITEEEPILFCVTYQKETLSEVKMMYKPNPSVKLDGPGYVTVTKDTPIAIDHEFICWRDSVGNLYYEGDKVYVDGEVVLYAVWADKQDNNPKFIRVIQAALYTFQRMLQKAFGIFEDMEEFDKNYSTTAATEPEITMPTYLNDVTE